MRLRIGHIARATGAALLIMAAPAAFGQDSPTRARRWLRG